MKVNYISACFDSSGYAEAARNNIVALHKAGVDVKVKPVSFEAFKADLGKNGKIVKSLSGKEHAKPDVQLIHLTPQHFPHMVRQDCKNIGYTTWETDTLPPGWKDMINVMDEVWVPSQHNVEMFKKNGVYKPVRCVPHTFDHKNIEGEKLVLDSIGEDDFTFYSVFQWLERKNPLALLQAYLTEFRSSDNTALILKTYKINPGNANENSFLKTQIQNVKKHLWMKDYPKVLLVSDLLSSAQMKGLHQFGDCFVTMARCEGFGIPIAEAMLAGNPAIATGYGGAPDFIDHGKTGYLVKHQMTPVFGMPWPMYTGDMSWANPDIMECRKYMREMYTNREKAKSIGSDAQKWIMENLSLDKIGALMKGHLEKLNG